jgi:hypothetical protein
MRPVTTRTRMIVLAVVALAWAVLGVVNLTRGHLGVGVLYLVLGALAGAAAMFIKPGRRAR